LSDKLNKEIINELIESEKRFRDIFNTTTNGLIVVNDKMKIVDINKSALKILGYQKNALIGKNILTCHLKKDCKECTTNISKALSGKRSICDCSYITSKKKLVFTKATLSSIIIKNKKHTLITFSDITQQKTFEKELYEEKEKFKSIFNNVSEGIVYADKYGRIIEINKAIEDMMGYKRSEVIGKHFSKLGILNMKDIPRMIRIFKKSAKKKKAGQALEFEIKDKKNKPLFIEVSTGIFYKDNKFEGFLNVIRNVTEQKKIEDALIESEKNLRSFFENANDLIQMINKKGEFVFVNKNWLKTLGYSKKEAQKMTLKDIIRNDQLSHCMELFKKVIKGKSFTNIETVFMTKNGKEIIVEGNVTPNTKDGKFISTRAIFKNITERKKTEEKLRMNEEKYRGIFNVSPDAIILLDTKGKLLDVNGRLYDWLGYKPKEMIGKNLMQLPFLNKKNKFIALKNSTMRILGKKVPIYDLEFTSKKGEIIIGQINATPIKNDKGKIVGDLMIISNVTEQRRTEELKLKHEQEKEIGKLRNQFLMRVSHELRHPIVPLIGYASVMLEENPSEIQKNYLEKILNNANRLKNLVNRVLNVTTLEMGKASLELREFNTKLLINDILSDFETRIELKGLKLIKKFEASPEITADRVRIKNVIENLIENSVKFTEKGSIKVTLDEDSENAIIIVEDTGKGMNKDELDRISRSAYDLNVDSYEEMYQGLKLGLILVNLVVKAHKGELIIKSKKDKGTKITILLPKK